MAKDTKQKEETGSSREMAPADDEWTSDAKECPECGRPVENLRKTCPNCGYEYRAEDYDQQDAGEEFLAGRNIDDEGNEVIEADDES